MMLIIKTIPFSTAYLSESECYLHSWYTHNFPFIDDNCTSHLNCYICVIAVGTLHCSARFCVGHGNERA